MSETLDITPSPRVLRMLGQIDFAPWQCMAELIDNSIDAFMEAQRAGEHSAFPRISVLVPSLGEIERGGGAIVIEDNARGMTVEQLQDSVRAGYSGNDPVDKMGLFGMGFNISTARLGRRTQVSTTTADASHWTRIVIDFDDLERRRVFQAPISMIPKTSTELEEGVHGTRVEISRLEPNRIRSLIWGAGKAKTKNRLGKIYGRVMTSMDITILYDGDRIRPWRHCVWDKSRTVPTAEFANVPAQIQIDKTLPSRKYCKTCWVWLSQSDVACPACGLDENLIDRPRRIRGWIGVQRYFDKDHFGIDLIRNGRVIEELDKSFFTFKDSSGEELFEYPRDAVHWGGRIVGELEIDFVRVSHQKDSFDKLDPEWRYVVEEVRGSSPLQPRIAERMALPVNTSPLARLFAGYRKGVAGLKDLVPGDSKGAGLNSGVVREYVDKFYAGDSEYQDDHKWYELVLQAERAKRGGSSGSEAAAGEIPLDPVCESVPSGPKDDPVPEELKDDEKVSKSKAEIDEVLSRTYELEMLQGKPAISVTVYRHWDESSGPAVRIEPNGTKVRYDYYPRSPYFEENLLTPIDCLVTDLAQHFLVLSASTPREVPVSVIAQEIRRKYFPSTLAEITSSAESAGAILQALRSHYDEVLPSVAPVDMAILGSKIIDTVRLAALKAESAGEEQVVRMVRDGQFARYVTNAQLLEVIGCWPDICLDGKVFSVPYWQISEPLRQEALRSVLEILRDLVWLADEAGVAISKDITWRLRFARALASLRIAENWVA